MKSVFHRWLRPCLAVALALPLGTVFFSGATQAQGPYGPGATYRPPMGPSYRPPTMPGPNFPQMPNMNRPFGPNMNSPISPPTMPRFEMVYTCSH